LKKYTRLALFLVVLTISVGLLATAINILGDIEKLDINQDRSGKSSYMSSPASLSREDEEIQVGGASPGKLGPIFMIQLPTRTKYLRRIVALNYTRGKWIPPKESVSEIYEGEYIPIREGYPYVPATEYIITPLTIMRGNIPVSPNIQQLIFNNSLLYDPELQTFQSPLEYRAPYWVKWRMFQYSDQVLRTAEPVGSNELLQVPSKLQNRFENLGLSIVGDVDSDYEKYRKLETYLRDNYALNEEYISATGFDPVEWFLFNNKEGISSHFNSAFVLLARSIGLPARVVQGFRIDPESELQYIMPQQAYLYAEVEFENLGWITFDASPRKFMEGDIEVNKTLTYTNITGNDPIAIKGKTFRVWGTVQTINGSAVEGPQVEILLKVNKTDVNETGVLCGVDFIEKGEFDVECVAAPELIVGDYNLVAHTLGNREYKESWSDPPIKIIAQTQVRVSGPNRVYTGKNITYEGFVVDGSNDEPLHDMKITVLYNENEIKLMTDSDGAISYTVNFPEKGDNNITLFVSHQEYYVGSNTTFGVSVVLPPPSARGLIALITSFPYNIIITVGLAVGVGFVAASRRKPIDIFPMLQEELPKKIERIGYEDNVPLRYQTYEEGIVKLFNRFYVSMQRIYRQIEDSMTPREFESLLNSKLPRNATEALNDLVTSYEIAMYSNMSLSEVEFNLTEATILLILELMKNGNNE
jgi:transglutaminase-like putative cysteine protease